MEEPAHKELVCSVKALLHVTLHIYTPDHNLLILICDYTSEILLRYIGGCCGFEPYLIRAIAEELREERKSLPYSSRFLHYPKMNIGLS